MISLAKVNLKNLSAYKVLPNSITRGGGGGAGSLMKNSKEKGINELNKIKLLKENIQS